MASVSRIAPGKGEENPLLLPMEMSIDERLECFVRYFVIELESTLQLHYDILEGYSKKSGNIPKFIVSAIGLPAELFIGKGADKLVKLFKEPLTKPFEVIEKNKSLEYYQIVYGFHRSKDNGRKVFVDIAIDVFASFEVQFAGITSTRGDRKAIKRVGKDAAQRFLNRFKSEEKISKDSTLLWKLEKGWNKLKKITKPQLPDAKVNYEMNAIKVVEGKSKSKSVIIPNKILKPGFDISYKCKKSHTECKGEISVWNTSDLFTKVGLAKKNSNTDEHDVYITTESNCEQYGYRYLFPDENVNENDLSEKCKTICLHPQMLKSGDFFESQREILSNLINNDDQVTIQRRILKLAEETKTDIAQFEDTIKKGHHDVLMAMETFKTQLSEIITRYSKDIQKQLKKAEEHRNTLATENKELQQEFHQETHRKMEELQQSNKEEILSRVTDEIKKIHVENQKSERVLFRVKNPTMSFEGRRIELEELHNALMNKQTTVISQTASIVGLGGIGKTELAKKYMDEYKKYYYNIIFINAEKSETILESFKSLANKIAVKLISDDEKERDIANIVEDIYETLIKRGNTLVVFDNAEDYKDIKKFIFENGSYYKDHVVCTLITSRSSKWNMGEKGKIKLIELKIFTEDEAMSYLRKSLENEDDNDLKSLMSLLQLFPLGLKQAVGYIKQQNDKENYRPNSKTFNAQDYIHLYSEKWNELLAKGHDENDDMYSKIIATTWRVTMQKIGEDGERGILALSLLKIMAYLAPDDINIEEIFLKIENDSDKLYEAVDLLHNYNMINNEKGRVNVHRLVQKAIQIYLIELKDEENTLTKALKLLESSTYKKHIMSVWEHSSNYPEIVKNKYDNLNYYNPIDLFIKHRNDTIAIAKILKHVKCDLNKSMHLACEHGNNEAFSFFIGKGANINYKHCSNQTSVHLAAKGGSVDILQLLIDKGLDVNMTDNYGDTPLFYAAINKRIGALKHLLKSGAHPTAIDSKGITVLHCLADYGAVEEFKLLLSAGVDPNIRDKNGQTPLHWAACIGSVDILQLLIDKGLDVNMTDNDGNTPLLCAAENNKTRALKHLLESGAHPTAINSEGITVLHHLAENGAVEEFKLLLSAGVDPNIRDKNGQTPLHWAACIGSVDILQLLIDKGLDVNMTDNDGNTPLLCAAENNKTRALKHLLESGAHPTAINSEGITVLHHLAENGAVEEFKLLLSAGADPNIRDKNDKSPLHSAAAGGSVDILQLLIDKGCNVNMTDNYGSTPLQCAASLNKFYAIKFLLENGADPKIDCKQGNTLIHCAAYGCDFKTFHFIKELGFDLTAVNKNGSSLLHFAVCGGNENIIMFLVEQGIHPNITNKFGRTPLHNIRYLKFYKTYLVQRLIKLGANPNAMSKSNCTPLHLASTDNNLEAATVLIEEGAEINIRNDLGRSALHYASSKCHREFIELLLKNGAEVNVFDSKGKTPLHHLSRNGKFKDVKLLLENGADPCNLDKAGHSLLHLGAVHFRYQAVDYVIRNVEGIDVNGRDVEGKTPLHLAAECGRVSIVGLLVRKGGDISATDKSGNTPLDLATKSNRAKTMDFFNSNLKGLLVRNEGSTNDIDKN
ncbi:uncharacterized protein LOC143919309 [Arctopsyche grandis]|uniref:uncharacterized protein LOC143919309 n=1 Tax=Arctopsyche grandis TaxID=121162 RepID=UPI00406D7C03